MDQELDSVLLQQFSSMATQDKEVLVSELQKVIGNGLNADGCAFFLDMNNWNLHGAVCSYFEFYHQEPPLIWLPKMSVVTEECQREGHSNVRAMSPNEKFHQSWWIMNSGSEAWPPGCSVRYFSGTQMTSQDRFMVEALQPGERLQVMAEMTSPAEIGLYRGQWRMSTVTGTFFGELLWVAIHVVDVTSEMDALGISTLAPSQAMEDQIIQHRVGFPGISDSNVVGLHPTAQPSVNDANLTVSSSDVDPLTTFPDAIPPPNSGNSGAPNTDTETMEIT